MARTSKPSLIAALAAFPVMAAAAPLPQATEAARPVGDARPVAAWTRFCEAYPADVAR